MKEKKLLCSLIYFFIIFSLATPVSSTVASMAPVPPAMEIRDWYDLHTIRDNLASNYVLMNDLDSTTAGYMELASETANGGRGWEPIGTPDEPFIGSFDGQGYEISDLFIDRPDEYFLGLFCYVSLGGVIEDVGVVDADVTGGWIVSGLVGLNLLGTVSNSYSTGSVTGDEYVGSLIGWNAGIVSNSYSTATVTGGEYVGGLVGGNDGAVSNSYYNYDEVLINGENIITIGALFAEDFEQWLANDKFLDVNQKLSQENGYYVIDDVSDFKELLAFGQDRSLKFRLTNDLDLGNEANFYIPYLAGEFDGNGHKILNLSFDFDFILQVGLFGYLASGGRVTQVGVENVNITGCGYVGGLAGDNGGTVSNSYSTGSVTGDEYVGGLVGGNDGTVSNSYSTGSVTGDDYVGGLAGDNGGTVSNSYSTGSVAGDEYVGGLVGLNENAVSSSFWDIETSGQATSAGGTGKTTAEMQDITTFLGAEWDICTVPPSATNHAYTWNIVHEQTYPFLSWEQPREAPQYTLTISSTAGGSVTTPGEGTFKYDAGTKVSLEATPDSNYGFVNWAGDVDTIANLNAATTTITMESDCEITARFVGVGPAVTETVTNSTVNAINEADIEVEVTGKATVTIYKYDSNPHPEAPVYGALASLDLLAEEEWVPLEIWRQVITNNYTDETEIVIRLYYTDNQVDTADVDEDTLRLFWYNGAWVQCSPSEGDSGVEMGPVTINGTQYSGYMWAKIRKDTTPSLDDLPLQPDSFGGYGHPSPPPQPCGCSITTAAYGTDTAKEIDIMREFRDGVLLPDSLGAEFVSLYYKTSPPIADFISQHEVLRTAVRVGFVDPIVAILNWSHDLWSARGWQ